MRRSLMLNEGGHFDYYPTPTLNRFHLSDAEVRIVLGPLGSGKTFGMVMECVRRACEQPPAGDGYRRSRCAIVRQTRPQIITTILPEIQQALGPFIQYKPTAAGGGGAIYFQTPLPDGTEVDSEWLFMPLAEEADQRRLLSLNLTWIWISEVRELNYSLVQAIRGRAGRYPARKISPEYWFGMIGESNPWSVTSDWHKHLVLEKPEEWDFFRQPSGLSPQAENIPNLPEDYYLKLMRGASDEWIDVHIHAEYGADLSGTPVYRTTFTPKFHTSAEVLTPNPQLPLVLGQDFGRTPATLFCQVTPDSRLKVFAEVVGENMGLEYFIDHCLLPALNSKRFQGLPMSVVGDPAGAHKDQLNEESLFECFERKGFDVRPAPTNEIDPRIRAVEAALLQHRGSYPAILIDAQSCPLLCQAMEFGYKYGKRRDGQFDEKPVKNHPWSDLADALGYITLSVFGTQMSFDTATRGRRGKRGKPITPRPRPTVLGWT